MWRLYRRGTVWSPRCGIRLPRVERALMLRGCAWLDAGETCQVQKLPCVVLNALSKTHQHSRLPGWKVGRRGRTKENRIPRSIWTFP